MRSLACALLLVLTGCTSTPPDESPAEPPSASPGSPSPTAVPEPAPAAQGRYDVQVAVRAVRHLAGVIGPRHGTSAAYREAASWVAGELEAAGWEVRRQRFPVPGGNSWGVPVPAGTGANLVASEPGFDPDLPHLVVGAHLDTVPQSPGAEDNASGVGVLLALARTGLRARLPVVLVAFGAEEPRGPGDANHHYGSRHYVAELGPAQRRAVRGMLSLDRVGVGGVVPVGAAEGQPTALIRAARRARVEVVPETGQRSSDHWSFVREGLPGLRIGSTPYAGYHSEGDVPSVVSRAQLGRVGRLVIAWLR